MAVVFWFREGMVMAGEKIRESVIAGSWYPESPQQLTREILKYVHEAAVEPVGGELKALIVPTQDISTLEGWPATHTNCCESSPLIACWWWHRAIVRIFRFQYLPPGRLPHASGCGAIGS